MMVRIFISLLGIFIPLMRIFIPDSENIHSVLAKSGNIYFAGKTSENIYSATIFAEMKIREMAPINIFEIKKVLKEYIMTTNLENIGNNEHLSINERYILTYIKYKTSGKYSQFFMNNETIAKQIGCKTSSTKTMVNKLIREGYLNKGKDERGRRTLDLTGKYYVPLDGVYMNKQEKSVLKQDVDNFERMEKQYRQDIAELKRELAKAEQERDKLDNTLQMAIKALEKRGITLQELTEMVSELENTQTFSNEPLDTMDKAVIMEYPTPEIRTNVLEANQDNSDVQEVIDGILAKLQMPTDYSKLI